MNLPQPHIFFFHRAHEREPARFSDVPFLPPSHQQASHKYTAVVVLEEEEVKVSKTTS